MSVRGYHDIKNFQLFLYCSRRWLFSTNPELISIVHHQTAFLSLWESLELAGLCQFSQSTNSIDSHREKMPSGGEEQKSALGLGKIMQKFWKRKNNMQLESSNQRPFENKMILNWIVLIHIDSFLHTTSELLYILGKKRWPKWSYQKGLNRPPFGKRAI